MSRKIIITGGTGLIGKALCRLLLENGHEVYVLTRQTTRCDPEHLIQYVEWNPNEGILHPELLKDADAVIHLAGESVADGRWTRKKRISILDSRTLLPHLLFQEFKKFDSFPDLFITASGTGYYGSNSHSGLSKEEHPPGDGFLSKICVQWEKTADEFKRSGSRTVKIRTGVVLSSKGGALEKMMVPVQSGVGAALGSGHQIVPWIHIDDLCRIYLHALENNNISGAFNAVSPGQTTNWIFMSTLTKTLKKRFIPVRVPSFILYLIYGKKASILLKGGKISSEKIMKSGFQFKYPDLTTCLEELLTVRNAF